MPRKSKDPQVQRFIEKARELGADESKRAFEDKLKRIAKAKPGDAQKAPAKKIKRAPRTPRGG